MKFIMNSHDIMAVIAEIKSLGECRVNNIYDVDGKFISLKIRTNNHVGNKDLPNSEQNTEFSKSDKKSKFIMLDAGRKIYLSDNKIDNDRKMPTSFIMKLRKHLENKLILDIRQINYDRVVDITFGYTAIQYHLIIEFYASGNIIFTDENYKILALTNTHVYKKDDNFEQNSQNCYVKVNEIYPLSKSAVDISVYDMTVDKFLEWYQSFTDTGKDKYSIKKLLLASPLVSFGKESVEHSLCELHIDSKQQLNVDQLESIILQIKKNHIINQVTQGYIIFEGDKADTFTPILYEQYKNKTIKVYDSFSKSVEEYYKLTSEKGKDTSKKEDRKKKKEVDKDLQKVINIKNQMKKMQSKYEEILKKVELLEEQQEIVTMILDAVNRYNNSMLDTFEIYIDKLNQGLQEHGTNFSVKITYENTNRVNIKNKKINITYIPEKYYYAIDPNCNAYDHVSKMYQESKVLLEKIDSTQKLLEESENVYNKKQLKEKQLKEKDLESTQEQIQAPQVLEEKEHDEEQVANLDLLKVRKPLWFEQFHWFISSDGFVVVVGKSADQNEILVKRYMEKNDLYMHSDVHGSGSCIIKTNGSLVFNQDKNKDNIPYMTLEEASCFLICHTSAWKSNSPDKSYWVYTSQVSKTPKTGEYVGKGSFIIIGEKNYLSIPRLELGLTIMFKEKNNEILTNKVTENTQFAIPMCAPYRLVNKNRFKIKIVPGNQSINKSLKNNILSILSKQAVPKENSYIKAISNDDYQRVLVPNMKILN
jgi:predicted ribosome quality control (RQC) complex YloA/Tae2 family protein